MHLSNIIFVETIEKFRTIERVQEIYLQYKSQIQ